MKNWKKYLPVVFWVLAIFAWELWVKERIEIFDYFVGNYKNIGYVVDTNDYQLGWYIIISVYKALLLLLLFYYIRPTFGFTRNAILRSVLLTLILMGLEFATARLYYSVRLPSVSISENFRLDWNYDFWSVLLIYLIYLIVGWMLCAAYSWIIEYRNLKTYYQQKQSYEILKGQLNPHFIFNTINSFYEIAVIEGNEKMQNSVLNLTTTLRYSIEYSDKDEVPVSVEVEAIKSYISLHQDRFANDNLQLETEFNIQDPAVHIAPLLLLNYVENAFKHGYKDNEPSLIKIVINENKSELTMDVVNTNHSRRSKEDGGNDKTKSILDLKYPGRYKLNKKEDGNLHKIRLWIQLN